MHLSPTLSLLTLYLVSSSIGTTTALVVRRRSTPPSTTPTTTTTTTTTPTPRYASKRLIGTKCDPAVIQQLCLDRDHHYLWCNVETLKWTSGYFADGFGPNGCQPVQHQTSTVKEDSLRPHVFSAVPSPLEPSSNTMYLSPSLALLALSLISSTTALVVRRSTPPPSTRYASQRLIGTRCDPEGLEQLCLDRDHHYLWCNTETHQWMAGYTAAGFGPHGCHPRRNQAARSPPPTFGKLRPISPGQHQQQEEYSPYPFSDEIRKQYEARKRDSERVPEFIPSWKCLRSLRTVDGC
ncbi:MAG: hypothetical protein M1826_005297 [Phylliscum demangeonii]|nr:MAG: hypothetical protein M1826_005297 [Phylliscum demangeonii]